MSYKKYLAAFAGMSPICPIMELRHKMPRILFYHGVMDEPYYDQRVQANQIQYKEFERQINFLKRHYHFISIDEFYSRFTEQDNFTGKELILTFDDGYKNNLTVAAPLLDKYRIPFTVFIPTTLVDKEDFVPTYYIRSALLSGILDHVDIDVMQRSFMLTSAKECQYAMNEVIQFIKTQSDDKVRDVIDSIENQLNNTNRKEIDSHFESERIMSWSNVVSLKELGGTIGSHSEDHSVLHNSQNTENLNHQLVDSRDKIIKHLGECNYFAFPNGDKKSVCEQSLKLASDTYKMSFAVTGKSVSFSDSKAYVARIGAAFSLNILKAQLSILA